MLFFVLTLLGAIMLAYSIYKYYKLLLYMKRQTYEQKIFQNWIYKASLLMMVFFLIGYASIALRLAADIIDYNSLLVPLIFFFGAVYVLCITIAQKTMVKTISQKNKEAIQSLVFSIEEKDLYTKGHSDHVHKLVKLFYQYLPKDIQNKVNFRKLKDAAILHDIGKIGIPDVILNKPGKLTPEEYEVIKTHPKNGKRILDRTPYAEIGDMIMYHHERIDGKGYYGLHDEEIPLGAKIIAICDVFSAIYTDRIYRKKYSYEEAIHILKESAGTQLDEKLVYFFCSIPQKLIEETSVSCK